jgi:acetolactate synthase small subunit
MPGQIRYNKLKHESKILMNIIKMICYRAETAIANELSAFLINAKEEKRMLVKQIIQNNADMVPDDENKTLTVILHSLSAPRFNNAAAKLAEILNQTETIFRGTDLILKFKTSATSNCEK